MAEIYIESQNVAVFPTTHRPDFRDNRLFNENNVVGMINQITDQKCFVITDNVLTGGTRHINTSTPFSICMNGYRFDFGAFATILNVIEDSGISMPLTNPTYITANITIVDKGFATSFFELSGDDVTINGRFTGISFTVSTTPPAEYYTVPEDNQTAGNYKLVIAVGQKVSGSDVWVIPDKSRIRQIMAVCDGGEI